MSRATALAELEASLADVDVTVDPDRWALAAYRLAVARIELSSRSDQLTDALRLLDEAAHILTPDRAPVEHARILTAAANGRRALGAPRRALALFEAAADLIDGRAPPNERAAALVNVGLARTETGDAAGAIEALDTAVALASASADEESRRVAGAALINRAQAHQAVATDRDLEAAATDYRLAETTVEPESPQAGMAAHGLGATILELRRRGLPAPSVDDAIAAFERAMAALTSTSYPFQHAIASHSLAVAYEQRGGRHDLARALDRVDASLAVFDPRLHRPQWEAATTTLARLDEALDAGGRRIEPIAALLADTSEEERARLLRDRLVRLSALPDVRVGTELDALAAATVGLGLDRYVVVIRTLLPVLMELPDRVLDAACRGLCRAHHASTSAERYDRALDGVIHDLLFGPQRIRVRDLLEAHGWVRP